MCVNMLTACTKANCKATSAISFKAGCGYAHSKYSVGGTITATLNYKVTSEETTATPVKAVLTIPHATNVQAKYSSGEEIPSKYNSWRNETTYELTADASKDAKMLECEIKFVPTAAGKVTATLVYDGHVDSSYDVKRQLEFTDDSFIDDWEEHPPEFDGYAWVYGA